MLIRALFASLLAWAVVVLVTAATDEGDVMWSIRFARSLPLVPFCAGIGSWVGLASARARGELRALASLGRTPWANSAGASFGGALVALAAALALILVPKVDISGFYPTATRVSGFHREGAEFVSHDKRWRIDGVGAITRQAEADPSARETIELSLPTHARGVAGTVTLLAGLAIPFLTSLPRKRRGAQLWGIALVALGSTVFMFQLAAAHHLPSLAAPLPLALLLLYTLALYKDPRADLP